MKMIEASGARIPALGFGTYKLTGDLCVRMVEKAIEAGYRHIDTARMYGNEREVGQGIRNSGLARSEAFVTTKVWFEDIGADRLVQSAAEAVEALDVGPVDLLLIHWPNAAIPLEDSIGALNEAKEKGLTRHIGVANFPSTLMDDAAAMSSAPLVCNQVEYHPLLSQEAILHACERNDMALIAYSPIGQGGELLQHPTVTGIANRLGRTPAQVILRWELDQPRVGAIPRTSNEERLQENFDVFSFELSDTDRQSLNAMTQQRKRLVNPSFAPAWDRI
ncbi:2,5-didehydrogluconate reductase [Aureimonas ureilytica]|uniref:2,5-didehydrogluconate reductase n=1 Tax=Aureimonas ureilytica TaxID=401562 RepID=A0A175R6H2_9HYPH|nr:aldo/keto reductase [Aureimonas ureilytica]KTQ95084.1 2,5-didehydrogluconate reductase [Aureimonas ureilytica]